MGKAVRNSASGVEEEAGSGSNNGNIPDIRDMFIAFILEMVRGALGAVPNSTNGGGVVVQAPRVRLAKINEES